MKALVLTETRPVRELPLALAELPEPQPAEGEVRVRVLACGVCRTDLHIVEGDLELPRLPIVPGHQVVGVVDAAGPGVTHVRAGDRVGVPWLHRTCQACEFCLDDRENLCRDALFTGFHVHGGYADFLVAPAGFVYPLPRALEPAAAAPLLCAGVIGYRALRLSEVKRGDRLGLYGFGASAHIAIQVARSWDCEVFVFSRSEAHQRQARELGAVWAGAVEDDPGARMHASVFFAPAGGLIPPALARLERGGTLAVAGIHLDEIPALDYETHLYQERTLRSVTASTRRDVEELLDLAAGIPIRTEIEVHPLGAANEALLRIKESRVRGAAVLRLADS